MEIKDLNKNPTISAKNIDVAILSHVLEHVNTYRHILRNVFKKLKKDGIAIIIVPINERDKNISHAVKLSEDHLISYLHKLGFTILFMEKNFALPKLPPIISNKKSLSSPLISIFSSYLNAFLTSLGYRFLICIDRIFLFMGMKPSQLIIVARK